MPAPETPSVQSTEPAGESSEPPSSPKAPYSTAWPWVLCVIGLDYLSTLAYQPSVAFSAAGRLAPLVTILVAAVTLSLPGFERGPCLGGGSDPRPPIPDAPPAEGKSGGAFCMPFVGDRSLVLLNWSGSAESAQTTAHELGHAYHNTTLVDRTSLQKRLPVPST